MVVNVNQMMPCLFGNDAMNFGSCVVSVNGVNDALLGIFCRAETRVLTCVLALTMIEAWHGGS